MRKSNSLKCNLLKLNTSCSILIAGLLIKFTFSKSLHRLVYCNMDCSVLDIGRVDCHATTLGKNCSLSETKME